jgi:hypothetical protein
VQMGSVGVELGPHRRPPAANAFHGKRCGCVWPKTRLPQTESIVPT